MAPRPGEKRKPLRIPPETPASPVAAPQQAEDLAASIGARVGASLDALEPTIEQLGDWNQAVTEATRAGFEHRVLVGIAIERLRPARGAVKAFNQRMESQLGRSERWIQETTRVSRAVELAVDQGIALPLEICDLAWGKVPGAIENLRNDRAMDYQPEKERQEPTPEERAEAVRKDVIDFRRGYQELVFVR